MADGLSRASFLIGAVGAGVAAAVPGTAAAAPPAVRTQSADGPLYDLEISEAADLIRRRKITAVQLAESVLERAAQVEDRVIAYALAYSADDVLAQARAADKLLRRGTYLGPLQGIPVGLKDIIFTKGILTEANSKFYRGFKPAFDA
ncbi:MAG TPA: amidase family protein, partial [Kribbella sp.]